jgi:hypothetical protein
MPKTPELEKQAAAAGAKQIRDELNALVGEQVMQTLGDPANLLQVQVRLLWDQYYRVNIFVGAHSACATIAHSYFIQTDRDGMVVASTPRLIKQYQAAAVVQE